MTLGTRRRLVVAIAAIAVVVMATLTATGWDPALRAWKEFRDLSPLQAALAAIAVLGVFPVIDWLLSFFWPPPPDVDKIVQDTFGREAAKLLEDQRRSFERVLVDQRQSTEELLETQRRAEARLQERIATAEDRYRSDVDDLVRRPSETFKHALALLEESKTDEAKRELEEIIKTTAASKEEGARAARTLAALTRLQDVAKAASLYQRATDLDPDNIQNWIDFGDLSVEAADLTEARRAILAQALDAYKQAIDLAQRQDPSQLTSARGRLVEALKEIASERHKQGKLHDALEPYGEALANAQSLLSETPDHIDGQTELTATLGKIAGVLDETHAAYLADARRACEHASELVEETKDKSRISATARKQLSDLLERIGDQQRKEQQLIESLASYRECAKKIDSSWPRQIQTTTISNAT